VVFVVASVLHHVDMMKVTSIITDAELRELNMGLSVKQIRIITNLSRTGNRLEERQARLQKYHEK
jgi:hypothetical protein